MNEMKTSVDATVWLPVSPVEAFDLVTRPDRLRRWLMVAGRIDLRVGGEVHLVVAQEPTPWAGLPRSNPVDGSATPTDGSVTRNYHQAAAKSP
ncbi:hypothetical protein K0651_12865 [Ornithinimicrobium sp. Arc0846-15]|nr:hypothetical protein [Ornithinimicrobium laminariae]